MIIQRRFAPASGHFEPETVARLAGISTHRSRRMHSKKMRSIPGIVKTT